MKPNPKPPPVTINKKEWTRSDALALAQQSCTFCFGLGLRPGRNGTSTPCNCVFRAIFRACYAYFRHCVNDEKHISHVSLESNQGAVGRGVYGLKKEEFCADFCLVARRALRELQHRVFRFHYLLGADWKLCCQKLAMERGEFFHECYRIEQILGRTFRELQPYALFPIDEYLSSSHGATIQLPEPTLYEMDCFEYYDDEQREVAEFAAPKKRGRPRKLRYPIMLAAAGD